MLAKRSYRFARWSAYILGVGAALLGNIAPSLGQESRKAVASRASSKLPSAAVSAWQAYSERSDVRRAFFVGEQNKVPSKSSFKARDGSRLLISERRENGVWVGQAWGRNDKYYFRVKRKGRNAPWVLTFVSADDPGTTAGKPRRMLALNESAFRGFPLQLNHFTLPMLIAHPSFETTDARHLPDGKFEFRFRADPTGELPNGTRILFESGRVVLDPEKSWLPVTTELLGANGNTMIFTHSDFRFQDGAWYPQRTVAEGIDRDGKRGRYGSGSMQVRIGEDVPEEEFTLSALGLPEPSWVQPPTQRPTRWWLWGAATGIGLLVLAVAIRGLSRRRSLRR